MKDLLSNYSSSEIVVFAVFVVIALKELLQIYDWFKARLKQYFDEDNSEKAGHAKLESEIEDFKRLYKENIDNTLSAINEAIANMNTRIDMLIDSDKESIKSEITKQHHYYVEEKGWIDYHSMDCLEKRFAIYEKEHGNSFAEDLMNEIRALPKHPICGSDENNKYSE